MKKLIYSSYIEKGMGYVVDRRWQNVPVVLHNHDFFEVELTISAHKTKHVLNGKKYDIEKGYVHIINPSDIHSFEMPNDGYFERFNVRFKQDTVSESVLTTVINNNCICKLSESDFNVVKNLFEVIEYYFLCGDPSMAEISPRIIESIILMIRDRSQTYSENEESKKSQIQRILLYLHKNFRNDITLQEIAKYSSFSPHYVSQLFHAETSLTLTQYVTKLRLEYAKNLLLSTDHSITEICGKCGFRSFAHFLRCFKGTYGTSPSKFRQTLREENKNQ